MKIVVTVKPHARQSGVEQLVDGTYKVSVNAPPHEGQANEAVIEALAHHLSVPKSSLRIVSGTRGKVKLIEVG